MDDLALQEYLLQSELSINDLNNYHIIDESIRGL